jgi:Ca2+-binding RTX toxin-like protein
VSASEVAFSDKVPTTIIHVSAGAAAGGDGSLDHPYATIQAAVTAANPGTAIYVHAGTYVENVKIPWNASGTTDAPIWLLSADGPQAATIVGASADKPVIQALGVDNYVIKNFAISGGYHGIQFNQSGADFTNMVNNIVVQGNLISGSYEDGIKIGQADNAYVVDNVVHDIETEEGIDLVGVTNSVISRNEIYNLSNTTAAIFAKGGSSDVLISDNYIHDVTGDGVSAGGWTDDAYALPGTTYEAQNIDVVGNKVVNVGKQPVSVHGAVDVTITDNYLASNTKDPWAVYIATGNPRAETVSYSSDVKIFDNTLLGAKTVTRVDEGNGAGVVVGADNGPTVAWNGDVGPNSVDLWSPAVADAVASIIANPSRTPWAESQGWALTIAGSSAADTLTGTLGNDNINGAAGVDKMTGGRGDDTYLASGFGDVVIENASEGIDTVWLYDARYQLSDNVENLIGKSGAGQTLYGNGQSNMLVGNAGADTLVGGGGSDFMTGGAGADIFMVSSDGSSLISDFTAGDKIVLAGDDFASFTQLRAALTQSGADTVLHFDDGRTLTFKGVASGSLTATSFNMNILTTAIVAGGATTTTLTGSSKFDVLVGGDANDKIDGRTGADLMKGGAGDDLYVVDNAGDHILEFSGGGIDTVQVQASRYALDAQVENATVTTSSGAMVIGNASANWIIGQDGADHLEGGGGRDLMTGGAGADVFVFHGVNDGADVITDFTRGQDKLDLSRLHQDNPAGTWSAVQAGSDLQVYFDDTGGHHLIATLQHVASLSAGDILF